MTEAPQESKNPWDNPPDLLGFEAIGNSFTNLIQSLDTAKVISIEAGFGRGKTFFRSAWAQQLRNNGEVVVEIDVQKSDHSGDPVITFLGALVEALPRKEKGAGEKAIESAKKLGAAGARAVAQIALRSGADELINLVADSAIDKLDDLDALDGIISDLGDGMSKAAGQMIASQMAAERVRQKEMPEQLEALRIALTEGCNHDRVIIIIDELDRCHPDYALSVLEAMKLVFSQSGYVFCLMINADYLERLAQHRFGFASADEKYLDKFVDIRLRLEPAKKNRKGAITHLASKLPLHTPFGVGEEFSVQNAAELAGTIAVEYDISMRKTESRLYKVELAMRCYSDQPLDPSLLVFLAFEEAVEGTIRSDLLPRSRVTPLEGQKIMERRAEQLSRSHRDRERDFNIRLNDQVNSQVPELTTLPLERYNLPDDRKMHPWALVYSCLAPRYIPMHQEILDAVALLSVPESNE